MCFGESFWNNISVTRNETIIFLDELGTLKMSFPTQKLNALNTRQTNWQ
jgi:hypothetical protein